MNGSTEPAQGADNGVDNGENKAGLSGLILGAIGVVFGDIGTSPLYTLKEAFSPHFGLTADHVTVLGILSLVFWALLLVVTLKYVAIIMRANNEGEGGIMALTALARRTLPKNSRPAYLVGILGILGASLFFGDSVITPAISVLSAVEGIGVVDPQAQEWVVPLAVLILLLLFTCQRYGTKKVGGVFGPIMLLWFVSLGLIGLVNIWHDPTILKALNPAHAMHFFTMHSWGGVLILGAVVLAVTGGEALYADMGHFGASPIRLSWFLLVLPALMLNYLGQGALVLENPSAIEHPFYIGVPEWARIPMIVLATIATIIASQAVITGAFSVSRQATRLGYMPRMRTVYTAEESSGQIYVPWINWVLMIAVIALVLTFESSTNLAAAYGASVSGTMLIDTLLLALVAVVLWPGWRWLVLPLCILFFIIDMGFVIANAAKFFDGAWFPVALSLVVFTMMSTWRRGNELLREQKIKQGAQTRDFITELMQSPPTRVPGTAVFLSTDPRIVPQALLQNIKHNKVLHERNVILRVKTLKVPYSTPGQRLKIEPVSDDFFWIFISFGFMEKPDVPRTLKRFCQSGGIPFDPKETTYFASGETIVPSVSQGMAIWRDWLFALMNRNTAPTVSLFRIPRDRLVELGTPMKL